MTCMGPIYKQTCLLLLPWRLCSSRGRQFPSIDMHCLSIDRNCLFIDIPGCIQTGSAHIYKDHESCTDRCHLSIGRHCPFINNLELSTNWYCPSINMQSLPIDGLISINRWRMPVCRYCDNLHLLHQRFWKVWLLRN